MTEARIEEEVEAIYELIDDEAFDEAQQRIEAALASLGEDPELLVLNAELHLEREQYDDAISLAEKALNAVDDDEQTARLHSIAGYAKYYIDLYDPARKSFNLAVQADPELATALIGRAMVHEQMGFNNAAMLDLDRVTQLDDQIGQPFAMRGAIYLRWGNTEAAEGDLAHAIQMDKEDEESRLTLARLLALQQRTTDALGVLEPLLDHGVDPEYVAPGAILRSQLSLSIGSVDGALEDAQLVIELLPDKPWGYLQVAACHISKGIDGGAAIDALKKAQKLVRDDRDLPDLYTLRAEAYEILGKPERAEQIRKSAEGVARLPDFVYGPLNPVSNIPINPNKPIDIRRLLDDLFGEAAKAPKGYEDVLRQIVDQIPKLAEQHPNVNQLQIELPEAPGMVGGSRQLVVSLGRPQQPA